MLIYHLLCARHCNKHFTCVFYCWILCITPEKSAIIFFFFFTEEDTEVQAWGYRARTGPTQDLNSNSLALELTV